MAIDKAKDRQVTRKLEDGARIIISNKEGSDYVFDSDNKDMLVSVVDDDRVYQVVSGSGETLLLMMINMFKADPALMAIAAAAMEQVFEQLGIELPKEKAITPIIGLDGRRIN